MKRTMAPRVDITQERIAELRRCSLGLSRGLMKVAPRELEELCGLALSTFNDFGTSGADLDEELCGIDDELERAGFEPGNTVRAIRILAAQAKRLALVTCPRCRRTTKRAKKPKRKGKKR
jgi:hypothetical protein